MLDADISDELRDLADEDQKLRALWARALQGAGGWTAMTPEERDALRERFTEEHGTTLDDMFGDKSRHKRILDLPSKIRWSSLADPDWNNLWIITQHMDQFPDFQERMLGIFLRHRGEDHSQYQYLADRVSCRETGTQRFGTQDSITNYSNCKWVRD